MASKYPPEFHRFMAQFIPGHTVKEIVSECRRRGYVLTECAVHAYKTNHHIKSGTKRGVPKGKAPNGWGAEVVQFIKDNCFGVGHREMAAKVNEKFGTSYTPEQMKGAYARYHCRSGLTGVFQKGHVPQNKGKKQAEFMSAEAIERSKMTRFRHGQLPHNTKPVGYERINADGYVEVKVRMRPSRKDCNDNFVPKHRLVWEQLHGPAPEGCIISFKDGNMQNCDPENLMLITRGENAVMNSRGLRSADPAAAETSVLLAKVILQQTAVKKKMRKK